MWENNYYKYLFDDVNSESISTFESCDRRLQSIFKMFLLGSANTDQSKSVFISVKNTALAEMVKLKKSDIETILKTAQSIGIKKNNDYGSTNILKYGIIGIIVRLGDKIARFKNLSAQTTKQMVLDENLEDTLLDIINYSTYGEMLNDGVWD